MGHLSDLNAVEKPVSEWLSQMSWAHKSKDELEDFEPPFFNPIIESILKEKIQAFNDFDEAAVQIVLEQLTPHHPDFHRFRQGAA